MVIARDIQQRWLPILAVAVSGAILLWSVYGVIGRLLPAQSVAPAIKQDGEVRRANAGDYKIQEIVNAHLFGETQQQVVEKQVAPRTRLQLKLMGMVASDDPKRAVAVIAANNGPSQPYRIGEAIKPSGAVLRAVEPEKVIIERSGRIESLYLERPSINAPGKTSDSHTIPENTATHSAPKTTNQQKDQPPVSPAPKTLPSPPVPG